MSDRIKHKVDAYYTDKIREFGPTSKGVDWNDTESQNLRFKQLIKLIPSKSGFSVLDYGSGFGSLIEYLKNQEISDIKYRGYDISDEMVNKARDLNREDWCDFTSNFQDLSQVDYCVASGIFNVKLDEKDAAWRNYIFETLDKMDQLSLKGFSFNMLSLYSDVEYRSDHLYYADPSVIFDHCKRNYAFDVALLHDYGLYEFTIIVRKELN